MFELPADTAVGRLVLWLYRVWGVCFGTQESTPGLIVLGCLRQDSSNILVVTSGSNPGRAQPMLSSAVEDSVGFDHVDAHVTNVMIGWIGRIVRQTCRQLLALHKRTSVSMLDCAK